MTVYYARERMKMIRSAELYGWGFIATLSAEQFASAVNGIGPDSWPQEWRDRLSKWLNTFSLAADVHDCRFTFDNDGTREKFDYANDEIEKNCLLLADDKYPWWRPRRYIARHAAHLIAKACRDFGWEAWQEAFEKTKQGETK